MRLERIAEPRRKSYDVMRLGRAANCMAREIIQEFHKCEILDQLWVATGRPINELHDTMEAPHTILGGLTAVKSILLDDVIEASIRIDTHRKTKERTMEEIMQSCNNRPATQIRQTPDRIGDAHRLLIIARK
jgi:hypothetical protein